MLSSSQLFENALQHHKTGRFDLAERGYRYLLRRDPEHIDALHLLGVSEFQQGKNEQAIQSIRQAITLNGESATFHSNLGAALRAAGSQTEAINSFRTAISLNPAFAGAHYNLGNALKDLRRFREAVNSYLQSIALQPENAEAFNNLGDALKELGRIEEAIAAHERAVLLNPSLAEGHFNLANALRSNDQLHKAIQSYNTALKLNPHYTEAYINLGYTFEDLADMEQAIDCYERAIRLDPDSKPAHLNRALAWLRQQDFQRGWPEYEWRRKNQWNRFPREIAQEPLKQSLAGSNVLVSLEQGVGDQLMFASCIPDLLSLASDVTIECDPRLAPLFLRSFPSAKTRTQSPDAQIPRDVSDDLFDFHIPIGSLPKFFRSDSRSFSKNSAYLVPDPMRSRQWKNRFARLGDGMKIGISWHGGKDPLVRKRRSTTLNQWHQILSLPNAHFINLQYGDSRTELNQIQTNLGISIHDWDDVDPLKDLDNLAAQISALDLVISVDNSTVHMAGALGIPTWVLLPFSSDWRWFFNPDHSLWYSSLRLFRQQEFNDWNTLFQQLLTELKKSISKSAQWKRPEPENSPSIDVA